MTDRALIEARIAELRRVRASGTRKARFGDEEIEYRSDSELAAAIADLERQLAGANGALKLVYFKSSKGL